MIFLLFWDDAGGFFTESKEAYKNGEYLGINTLHFDYDIPVLFI